MDDQHPFYRDIMVLEGMRNHPLDPSELPEHPARIRVRGMSSKLVLDGTVPYTMKHEFKRAGFLKKCQIGEII